MSRLAMQEPWMVTTVVVAGACLTVYLLPPMLRWIWNLGSDDE